MGLMTFSVIGFQNCGHNSESSSANSLNGAATTTSTGVMTLSAVSEAPISGSTNSIATSVLVTDAASTNYSSVWALFDANNNPVVDTLPDNGITDVTCSGDVCSAVLSLPDTTVAYTAKVTVTDDQGNSAVASLAIAALTTPLKPIPFPTPHPICPAWGCSGPRRPIGPMPE